MVIKDKFYLYSPFGESGWQFWEKGWSPSWVADSRRVLRLHGCGLAIWWRVITLTILTAVECWAAWHVTRERWLPIADCWWHWRASPNPTAATFNTQSTGRTTFDSLHRKVRIHQPNQIQEQKQTGMMKIPWLKNWLTLREWCSFSTQLFRNIEFHQLQKKRERYF